MTTPGMPHTPAERPEPDGYCTDCDVLTTEINGQPWHTAPRKFDEYWLECRDFGPLSSDIRTYAETCTQGDLGTPHPPAQPGAGDTDTAGTETDRGTGVPEAPRSTQAIEELNSLHWLKWNTLARTITGCHCGFRADESSDCGFGDSVVAHLLEVGAEAARPVHYRDAAASLRNYAHRGLHPGRFRAFRDAADLLDSTARDLTEETT